MSKGKQRGSRGVATAINILQVKVQVRAPDDTKSRTPFCCVDKPSVPVETGRRNFLIPHTVINGVHSRKQQFSVVVICI